MTNIEEWRDIPGYEGSYQVSTWGNVRSVDRMRRVAGGGFRLARGKVLRDDKFGAYRHVSLCRGAICKSYNVHILVLTAFWGEAPKGLEGCHNDGVKHNCQLSNLRWDYHSGNERDKLGHGVSNHGERCGSSKLTAVNVLRIRHLYASGTKQKNIAGIYAVSQSAVSLIVNSKRWSIAEDRQHARI